jgi:periplasmic protein CpxP/Spy
MKRPFTFLASTACLYAFLTLGPAASGQTTDPAAKLQALSQQLKLTPQQKMQMLPILKEEGPKLEAIKNNPSLPPMQKMKQLRAIHEQSAPQLQKILSPAQYQQLQAIRQQEIQQAIARKRAHGAL